MTQHTDLFLSTRHYSRADYAALRSYCLSLPFATIARLYYTEDSPQITVGLEKYLLAMRDDLIERALLNNPHLAGSLQHARRGGRMTDAALRILRNAAEVPAPVPQPDQLLTLWMKPRTVTALRQEGVTTLAELKGLMERRGSGWWRAVPRIGRLRARVLEHWITRQADTLGALLIDRYLPTTGIPLRITVSPQCPAVLAPLGSFTTSVQYDGSQGINRAGQFCFIQAKNDPEAIEFYLSRYSDQPHTLRAYRRELERFLLWAIVLRGKPLSSLLVDDCEAYKRFLAAPSLSFSGPKVPRFSSRWRPFSEKPLSAKSQRQAIIILRATFDYLTGVRYLGGNPWIAVKDPSVRKELHPMQIHKALPASLWNKVVAELTHRATGTSVESSQYRIALAACLLMGDSGLRREEVTKLKRQDIVKSTFAGDVWECRVTGKGNRERQVPVSQRTIRALQTHWLDRRLDWNALPVEVALLAPLYIPRHASAQQRHAGGFAGYTPNNLSRLVRTTFLRLLRDPLTGFSEEERRQFFSATAHHLRHTFGTLSVADGMPIDVTQAVLGHASPATTAIYVQARQRRIMEEAGRFYDQDKITAGKE